MLNFQFACVLLALLIAEDVADNMDIELINLRRNHGQSRSGLPFYADDSLEFDAFVASVKEIEATSSMSRVSVQELHEVFLKSGDDDRDIWHGWKEVCDLVELLSDFRGCIDAPSSITGHRATHSAAMRGNVEKMKWLAENGADLNAITAPSSLKGVRQTGFSPAHLAAMSNNLGLLDLLERGGANLFHQAPGGYTPLDVAIEKGNSAAIKWLQSRSKRTILTEDKEL
jgi:ankyrin repeat protein